MIKQKLKIENVPAILWEDKSDKLFVVVHGNMSNKEDDFVGEWRTLFSYGRTIMFF